MQNVQPILSICIPTYNRAKDLDYNLSLLEKCLNEDHLSDKVLLYISNNCSTDNTSAVIELYQKRLNIISYEQDHNIGGQNNTLFLVGQCDTEWVMLLGDDDYLEPWYISECLKKIAENHNLGCIIPNYIDYYPATDTYGELREENCETEYYKAGYDACLQNAWRGHQLSGLCFRREGLIEAFRENKMDNMYPQIFFVACNALRYDVLHFGQKCLCVSGVLQSQKDWGYGDDGLVNDIFENFRYLGVTRKQRALLEYHFLQVTPRYYWVENKNLCIEKILTGNNTSYLGRYYIALQIIRDGVYNGRKMRLRFYLLARFVLLKKLLTGKPIGF